MLLMPGLAFDAAGRRCGRAGGYYDKLLARLLARAAGRGWSPPLLGAPSMWNVCQPDTGTSVLCTCALGAVTGTSAVCTKREQTLKTGVFCMCFMSRHRDECVLRFFGARHRDKCTLRYPQPRLS